MTEVSVLILARNEERNIGDCIQSVAFAKEVIVIDDFSTDKTKEIAESLGAKVVQRALHSDWGAQKNFALQQASCDWILFLDADERISASLGKEIEEAVKKGEPYAYWIKRKNKFHYHKAEHGVLRPDFVCRLLPKKDTYVEGVVHEAVRSPYERKECQAPMYHYTYDNWEQYFGKFNHYTTLAAEKSRKQGKSCSFVKDILFRPAWAFFKIYILNQGFRDGKIGWILSVNHYFYTLNKYVKLYTLYKSQGKL